MTHINEMNVQYGWNKHNCIKLFNIFKSFNKPTIVWCRQSKFIGPQLHTLCTLNNKGIAVNALGKYNSHFSISFHHFRLCFPHLFRPTNQNKTIFSNKRWPWLSEINQSWGHWTFSLTISLFFYMLLWVCQSFVGGAVGS